MLPALEALPETTGSVPEQLSVDNGYASGNNLQALADSGIDAYVAPDKGEKAHKNDLAHSQRKLVKDDFVFDDASNTFTCPGAQTLIMISESRDGSCV